MSNSTFEHIGGATIRKLFEDFDITEYCNAQVDEMGIQYCIKKFKEACKKAGIPWQKKWEDMLNG